MNADPSLEPLSHRELYLQVRKQLPQVEHKTVSKTGPEPAPAYNAALADDVRLLGALLGMVITEHRGEAFYQFIEKIRIASKSARMQQAKLNFESFDSLIQSETAHLPKEDRLPWMQDAVGAFRLFLTLTDIAEGFHRSYQFQHNEEGIVRAFGFYKENNVDSQKLISTIDQQTMRLVATAHPTTILRQTLLRHQRDIFYLLEQLHTKPVNRIGQQEHLQALTEKIEVLWATHFSRWTKPQVKDEVNDVIGYFSRTLYETLPQFYEKLDATLEFYYQNHIPGNNTTLTIGSWVGGDMDGNPYVTSTVFEMALLQQYRTIISLYIRDLELLAPQISHAAAKMPASPQLRESIEADLKDLKNARLDTTGFESSIDTEPHRLKLLLMAERLKHSKALKFQAGLSAPAGFHYLGPQNLLNDLNAVIDSLKSNGYSRSVNTRLNNLKQKILLFGFHFAMLDLREDTQNIGFASETILKGLGKDINLSSDDKIKTLTAEILSPQIIHPRQLEPENLQLMDFSPEHMEASQRLMDILGVAQQMHKYMGLKACRNFILSMTHSVEDVLNALLLLKTKGLFYKKPAGDYISEMNIVPLFETIQDLQNAPVVFEAMLNNDAYRQQLACHGEEQIIMLGYSDSNKDGGYFCSNWSIYTAQKNLLAVAQKYNIKLRFFYGRGGSIGRGGGPSQRAIQGLPSSCCLHGLEMTEQGEVLSRYYNVPEIALSHLENLFCALLQKNIFIDSDPQIAWEETSEKIAQASFDKYANLVHNNRHFIEYFEQVTPREVELIHIGSRPQRRRTMKSVQDLRAIPWVFRWYQSRQILPGWYGMGSGLKAFAEASQGNMDLLKTMYKSWSFFQSLIENSEIALRQTDLNIARYYCSLAKNSEPILAILDDIEAEYHLTRDMVQQITGQPLLERAADEALKNSIELKEPYLDPLNYIQVKLLSEYRALPDDQISPEVREPFHLAIVSSIEGIATGLGTTG